MAKHWLLIAICTATMAVSQTAPLQNYKTKKHTTAKHDVGSGAGDIGKGAAKGVASAAKGAGKAAADLVTLHPIGAATDLGVGAVGAGKNIGFGAVKGSAKIVRGTGKALKHLF